MAVQYCDWAKVLSVYSVASQVESNGANQTALIEAKSEQVAALLRPLSGTDLESPYDEGVKLATAYLVQGELERRRLVEGHELTEARFDHITGEFTSGELAAHAIIQSYRRGEMVLRQCATGKDIHHPDVVLGASNTSVGRVECYLPHEYKSDRTDEWLIKCTTGGRVDDGDARFSIYKNNNATAEASDVVPQEEWYHLGNELYVRWRDTALSSASWVQNDTWAVTARPMTAEARDPGPRTFEMYSG